MTESLAIVPRSFDELEVIANRLASSTLIPTAMRDKMPNVLVTIMAGQELGLAPMAALRGVHVIEGTPRLSADTMVAVVLGSGKAEYFDCVEESDTSVTYETKRRGSPRVRRRTWTIENAKKAGLHLKDNWRAYPRDMLAARAKSSLARDVYPDVLAGCYTPDEADEFARGVTIDPVVSPSGGDVQDAEVVSETQVDARKPLPWWVVEIEACETEETLKSLAPRLAALAGEDKSEAKKRYAERLGLLRQQGSGRAPAVASQVRDAEEAATVVGNALRQYAERVAVEMDGTSEHAEPTP